MKNQNIAETIIKISMFAKQKEKIENERVESNR